MSADEQSFSAGLPGNPSYVASTIKRERATKRQMEERREQLLAIVAEQRPMTVRQCFYQATVRGLVEKSEAGYARIQTTLVSMRRDRTLPFYWITDNTRWMRKPSSFDGLAGAASAYVEIWLEKDALAGVVVAVTYEYDVPLMVSRGYASLSYLHEAAQTLAGERKPCFIYHFGDFDPSGVNAAEKIEETLRELAPVADIHFERMAVTPRQIVEWELPSRPTKSSDSRSKAWTGGNSVELDAISPDDLRALVRRCIERHLSRKELEVLKSAEESEREALLALAEGWFEFDEVRS